MDVTDIYIKYNQNNRKATVIRVYEDGSRELMTKTGNWIPFTEKDALFNPDCEIPAFNVTPGKYSPPD